MILGNDPARRLLAGQTVSFRYTRLDLEPYLLRGATITVSPLSTDPVVGDLVLGQGRVWAGKPRGLLRVAEIRNGTYWLANGKGRIVLKAVPRRLLFGKVTAVANP